MSGGAGNAYAYKFNYEDNSVDLTIPLAKQNKSIQDYKNGISLIIRDYEKPKYNDLNQFTLTSNSIEYITDQNGNLSASTDYISSGFTILADGYKAFKFPLSLDYLKGSQFNRLYMYKTEYRKDGEIFFRETLKKYFSKNEIKYIV